MLCTSSTDDSEAGLNSSVLCTTAKVFRDWRIEINGDDV